MQAFTKFTIITSTLNSGSTLERCLRSVACQSYPHFEHLIVDGASHDDTLEIASRFYDLYPLKLVCSQTDNSLYQAWNRGIEQAKGDWILFLGSDDFFISESLLNQVAMYIQSDPQLNTRVFLYGDTISSLIQPDWRSYHTASWLNWLRGVTEYPTSIFINASVFAEGHKFDESYRICADHKFFAQHQFYLNSQYLPIPMISFQAGGISSNQKAKRLHYLERKRMLAELGLSRPFFMEWYYNFRSIFGGIGQFN